MNDDLSDRGKDYGWIMFKTLKDAIHAYTTIGGLGLRFQLHGCAIRARYAESDKGPMDEPPPSKRLFVGRFHGTRDDFYDIFDAYKEQINYLKIGAFAAFSSNLGKLILSVI